MKQQRSALRVRTLQILWHCNEQRQADEKAGLQNSVIEGVTSIDYNMHNNRILTTGGDKCIRMWQLHPGAIDTWLDNSAADMTACCTHLCTFTKNQMPLTARWSPQGELFVSGHCNGYLYLWWKDKSCHQSLVGDAWQRSSSSSSGTGRSRKQTKSSANDNCEGNAVNFNEKWNPSMQLKGHVCDVYDVCFSPCSRFVLSGSCDGAVMVHSIEEMSAVVQLTQSHGKFCRGVAWDPWNRFFVTFGAAPALQLYTVDIPLPESVMDFSTRETPTSATIQKLNKAQQPQPQMQQQKQTLSSSQQHRHSQVHKEHVRRLYRLKRLQVLKQEKCDGDYLGESCAMAFRRLSFSPDGLLLAVPFGKLPRTARTRMDTNRTQYTMPSVTSAPLPCQHHAVNVNNNNNNVNKNGKCTVDADDLAHCVNIYARHAFDKLMCRLAIRGYNEIRGVQWAPCFFAPVHVAQSSSQSAGDAQDEHTHEGKHSTNTTSAADVDTADANAANIPSSSQRTSVNESNTIPLAQTSEKQQQRQQNLQTIHTHRNGVAEVNNTYSNDSYDKMAKTKTTMKVKKQKQLSQSHLCEMWGPAEYRMALAVWTSDAVLVYTTDSTKRHSDYTDLHMRSIIDLAWSGDGAYLYTASLDGYISVISFGNSLYPSSRLPIFAHTSPLCRIVHAIRTRIDEVSKVIEFKYSDQYEGNGSANVKGGGNSCVTVVAVRKKKKKKVDQSTETALSTTSITATQTSTTTAAAMPKHAEVTQMELKQLQQLMSDVQRGVASA